MGLLIVDIEKLKHNIRYLVEFCRQRDIEMAGILKGPGFNQRIIQELLSNGVDTLGFGRLPLNRDSIDFSAKKTVFISLPSIQDIDQIVQVFDVSFHSQFSVIKHLNDHLIDQNRFHKIVLMVDTGDLREGVLPEEVVSFVRKIHEIKNKRFEFTGIAANLGCCAGILPTLENLSIMQELTLDIEAMIGSRLETVSMGGSLMLEWAKNRTLPKRINQLRLGESVFLGHIPTYDHKHAGLYDDVLIFKSDVLEASEKRIHPPANPGKNALGVKAEFTHTGIRKRAVLNFGVSDTYPEGLTPVDEGLKIVSVNSNYTIIDFTDSGEDLKPGDFLEFKMNYQAMFQCFISPFTSLFYRQVSSGI